MSSSLLESKLETEISHVDGRYTRIKNTYIPMRDGIELCANVFLPLGVGNGQQVPVICSFSPYGKDIHASEFGLPHTPVYAHMFKAVKPLGPDACFETPDPIIWVKEFGYGLVRVDTRGVGGSQGSLDPMGIHRSIEVQDDAEGQDLYDIIEWAGTQPWSSGKVAISGISYLGMFGYWAAMQQPPHLTCVMSYESACDLYQVVRRGGILNSNFLSHWLRNTIFPQQTQQDRVRMTDEMLLANILQPLENDEYPTEGIWPLFTRVRKLSSIRVPFYSAGNWTDAEVHLPGNIRAFNEMSSQHKWLEMHTGNHIDAFYAPDQIQRQRQFFDCFMLGRSDNGMLEVPRIRLIQHHGQETFYRETETEFPPADPAHTPLYLTSGGTLSFEAEPGRIPIEYDSLKGSITFGLESPFAESFEIVGSPYLELEIMTEAQDMDLFVYLRALKADGSLITLKGNHGEPMDSFNRGFFRLSHRDEIIEGFKESRTIVPRSLPRSTVVPGQVYSVAVPLCPTAFLFGPGQRLHLEIGSVDSQSVLPAMRHDGGGRVEERFGGKNVIYSGGRLVLPRVYREGP